MMLKFFTEILFLHSRIFHLNLNDSSSICEVYLTYKLAYIQFIDVAQTWEHKVFYYLYELSKA